MIALALVTLLSQSPLDADELKAASCDGKYEKLLRVITLPEDAASYGERYEYGWYAGTEYGGHEGLRPGYWVWVAPRWYIWKAQRVLDGTFGGKYRELLRTVEAPQDAARYGQTYDYGWWSGSYYAGQRDLPAAYWTYVAPRWLLWKSKRHDTTAAPTAPRPPLRP